jgi:hypothetical protein
MNTLSRIFNLFSITYLLAVISAPAMAQKDESARQATVKHYLYVAVPASGIIWDMADTGYWYLI